MGSRGKVYVGKKGNRELDPVIYDVLNINCTSGSMNKINGFYARTFSPMILGPVIEEEIFGQGDQTAIIFENYWQYSKIFIDLDHLKDGEITDKWLKFREYGFSKTIGDRHPKGTKTNEVKFVSNGKRFYRYLNATSSYYLGSYYDYISSRKIIYAPIYAHLVSQTDAFRELKKLIDEGLDVQILDFDVLNGSHEVTLEFLKDRINDPNFPFGHGYVLAGLLSNIEPDQYCYDE